MRTRWFNKAAPFSLSLVGLVSVTALASEDIRISKVGDAEKEGTVDLYVQAGQPVDLQAAAYEDGREAGDLSASLQWRVECAGDSGACAPSAFTNIQGGRGRVYDVPSTGYSEVLIQVSGQDGSAPATFDLHIGTEAPKVTDDADPSSGPGASEASCRGGRCGRGSRFSGSSVGSSVGSFGGSSAEEHPRGRGRRGHGEAMGGGGGETPDSSGAGQGSSGAGSARADSSSSGSSSRDSGMRVDASFGPGGGGSGAPANPYAQGPSVQVVSCSHVKGADGLLHLACEDPAKKVLHVRPKTKAELAAAKKAAELAAAKKKKARAPIKKQPNKKEAAAASVRGAVLVAQSSRR